MTTTLGIAGPRMTGAGSIGSALLEGWLRSPDPELALVVHGIGEGTGGDQVDDSLGKRGVTVAASLDDLAARADIVLVAAEPEDALQVFEALRRHGPAGEAVISSAAGITLERIRSVLGPGPTLFRVVPNLGVGLGEGVLVVCPEVGAAIDAVKRVARLFACMGVVEVLPEDSLEAATAVAGSSIGFLAVALEGVVDGAVQVGLPRPIARSFVRQTALGAALLLQSHPGSPADLKDQVASPGGTTIAGLAVLEDLGVRGAFIRAIEAAAEHGRQGRDEDWPPVIE